MDFLITEERAEVLVGGNRVDGAPVEFCAAASPGMMRRFPELLEREHGPLCAKIPMNSFATQSQCGLRLTASAPAVVDGWPRSVVRLDRRECRIGTDQEYRRCSPMKLTARQAAQPFPFNSSLGFRGALRSAPTRVGYLFESKTISVGLAVGGRDDLPGRG